MIGRLIISLVVATTSVVLVAAWGYVKAVTIGLPIMALLIIGVSFCQRKQVRGRTDSADRVVTLAVVAFLAVSVTLVMLLTNRPATSQPLDDLREENRKLEERVKRLEAAIAGLGT